MLIYTYIVFIFIAFLSSLRVYRLDSLHYKVIAIIMAADLVVEIWANLLWPVFHLHNLPVYNFALLMEFWLYAYYFSLIIQYKRLQQIIRIYLYVLPVLWILLVVFLLGIDKWNSHFLIIGSLFTIFLSGVYYYQLFTADELVRLSTSFEFWIATALIFYFGCTLPFLGMLQLLTKVITLEAQRMLNPLQIFNIIFYSIVTYAFLCTTPIKKSSL